MIKTQNSLDYLYDDYTKVKTPFGLGVCARILSRYDRSDDTENFNTRIGE